MKAKRVVVTGASSGIGKAIACKLLAESIEVIALSRTPVKMDGVRHIPVDLRDKESIEAAFNQIKECDALVNNAGVAHCSPISEGGVDEWDEMWEVNVRALSYCSYLALDKFPDGGGQIINLSSMSGHRVPPSGGFYASTKFAVRAVSEALRLELRSKGSQTRISSVSPGFVDTPLLDIYFKGRETQLVQTKKKVEFLTSGQVADQVIHILNTPLSVEIGDISLRSASQSV